MQPIRIASGAPWESQVGYSRLVKMGAHIYVTGTTAVVAGGQILGEGNAYEQALQCIKNIESALQQVGAKLTDIMRTRMYVIDIERDWPQVGRAHRELLGATMPATTMVQVVKLIDPRLLVEIEADAYVAD
jgi:enamine deaminase RidA (YjgF/YER057c/UK114 family)